MARRNPKGSREIAVFNLTEGSITPQIVEDGQPLVPTHQSKHMDRVRDLLDGMLRQDIAYENLSPQERTERMQGEWVIGYFYEGLSYRDLEDRYQYSHEHIRRTIFSILAKMRTQLEELYDWKEIVE